MKKVFLTFGSDNTSNGRQHIYNANSLSQQIKVLDIFDENNVFTLYDLINDKTFWEQHGEFIINNERGFGYWIWKPYLIMKTMEKLNDGDIILYLDSECKIVLTEKQYLLQYLDIVKEKKLLYYYQHIKGLPEITLNKMDVIHKLNMQNSELLYTDQYGAGIQLIYVCKKTRELTKSIYDFMCEDYHSIDDTPSIIQNYPNFYQHRHDQSLFSLLVKKNNLISDIIIDKCIYSRSAFFNKFKIIRKIIFFNDWHIGDHLYCKSFIKQFCELNKNFDISLMVVYNSFLFSDISNLNIIMPSNDIEYTNNNFNGLYDPINSINIDNNIYKYYRNIIDTLGKNKNYHIYNDEIIFINLWIGAANDLIMNIECDLAKCNNYFNNIIHYNINNSLLNINLINNIDMLPSIPYTNIDVFLNYISNNKKKTIFYYNYYPNSGQYFTNINHEYNIKNLSIKYKDYIICCADKPEYNADNIIYIEQFGYTKNITCENIAKALYCAMNSDIVFSFDIGACFYYLNNLFDQTFKGVWFHIGCTDKYYKQIANIDIIKKKILFKNTLLEPDITSYI